MKCAICGKTIKRNRYILKIASYCAYDGLEINLLDLTKDFEKEIEELLKKVKRKKGKKLEKDVAVSFKYNLCLSCHRKYTKNPLKFFKK